MFELEFLDDIAEDFEDNTDGFTFVGEKGAEDDPLGDYDGEVFTLSVQLNIDNPFDGVVGELGFGAFLDDYTDEIDISSIFGPIPESVDLVDAPVWAWYTPTGAEEADVDLRLEAEWDDDEGTESSYIIGGESEEFESLNPSFTEDESFEGLENALNDRPENLVLHYEFGTDNPDDVDSVSIRFEIPFEFETTERTVLDFEEDEEENGDNPLVMDEDIFGRDPEDPDEDLQDLLEALRGSNAELVLYIENTTGFGATLGLENATDGAVDKDKPGEWPEDWFIETAVSPEESEQRFELVVSSDAFTEMIDGTDGAGEFIPEFIIELPYEEGGTAQNTFSLNRGGGFDVKEGYLRVKTDIDYRFSLGDED
ncbi:MAG: hypothetical protein ACLFUX_00780 [Spirochaetaceae bacterium]